MNLLLLPIMVSVVGLALFFVLMLVAFALLLNKKTARTGKRLLVYFSFSLVLGLVFCWIDFGLLLLYFWPLERYVIRIGNANLQLPIALFLAGGPTGIVLGAIVANRFLVSESAQDIHA
jgi:hypothetical protein